MKENFHVAKAVEGRWPTEAQILLLRAALLQEEPALTAWRTWRVNADLDQLPPGGFGLLPLLAHNLRRHHDTDPLLDKCQGIHRRTWTQNQLTLQQVASLVQTLQDQGGNPLLLGDLLLAMVYYPRAGLRRIEQVHLLTAAPQTSPLQAQVSKAGWQRQRPKQAWQRYLGMDSNQPQRFQQPNNGATLHCHHLSSASDLPFLDDIWQNTQPLSVNGVTMQTLNPTDCLLWTCSQGIVDSWRYGAIQWLADAFILLCTRQAEIDWSRLLKVTTQLAFTIRMNVALLALQHWLDAPIPSSILQALSLHPVHPFEKWEAQFHRHLPGQVGRLLALCATYQRRNRY